ncbi:chaperone modulator CbpM [Methylomonas sp. MgM2]
MSDPEIMIATVVEESGFSLEQLAALCAVEPEWVLQHIEDGLLSAVKLGAGTWRFSAVELTRAKRIVNIERNFDATPELAALVADLQEELDSLRRQLLRIDRY